VLDTTHRALHSSRPGTPAASLAPDPYEAAAELVALRVALQPADAALYLDGQRLSSNPTLASMVRDARSHTLRGEASGFLPFSRTFSTDVDVAIEATLEPVRPGLGRRSGCARFADGRCTRAPLLDPRKAPR
jgi:hypothetical protein